MLKQLSLKLKESAMSVLPISLLVIILNFTPLVNLTNPEIITFSVSSLFLILGISLFNLGADIAMSEMGKDIGSALIETKKLPLIFIVLFILGFLITYAEPDLSALGTQLENAISPQLLIITISLGVGIFLVIGTAKIIFKKELNLLLMYSYGLLFGMAILVIVSGNEGFIPISFDSGGVTTGPITVPFIMALGVGIAIRIGGKNSSENSFGMIALCSVGPILATLLLAIFSKEKLTYEIPSTYFFNPDNIGINLLHDLLETTKNVSIALGMIVGFFIIMQIFLLKLPKIKLISIAIGLLYTFLGLIVFLSAVEVGFMPIGFKIGQQLAKEPSYVVIIFSFIIGLLVVLAEPAIHVLVKQVSEITYNQVSKRQMLISLCLGVGLALCLSIIRIIFDFSILYLLVPLYFLSLGLSFFIPKLYTAIAFDSGGVASGPLASSFILPLAIGVASIYSENDANKMLSNGFGIVAMIALTPLITIQLLGFKAVVATKIKEKIVIRKLLSSNDEQIIDF